VDIVTRIVARALSEFLGQQFIIENKPGASGDTATEAVVRATPDGYTLLVVLAANAINAPKAQVQPGARSGDGCRHGARTQCHGGKPSGAGEDRA
jgi:tripartite-type tricarboxylate transporter receptor subunit TctC